MNHELLKEHTDITTYLRNSVMFDALVKVLFKPRHRALVGYITREQYRSKKEKNPNGELKPLDDHESIDDALKELLKYKDDPSANIWEQTLDSEVWKLLPEEIKVSLQ